jgi:uncharacterized glyoxalase superfamily protein PhnB
VKANRSIPSAGVIPVLTYPDVRQAVEWLTAAFGFEERLRIGDAHRSQLIAGEAAVIVADVSGDRRPPERGSGTHLTMVRVADVDFHYKRAKAFGASVVSEPASFPYGERQYTVDDLGGHRWTFSETLADVDPIEWGGEVPTP